MAGDGDTIRDLLTCVEVARSHNAILKLILVAIFNSFDDLPAAVRAAVPKHGISGLLASLEENAAHLDDTKSDLTKKIVN